VARLIAPHVLRPTIALSILSTLGSDWVEATVPYAILPDNVSRQTAHRCFAVGLIRTEANEDRQKRSPGFYSTTSIGVRALIRVRADLGPSSLDGATLNDEDAALKDEASLVGALRLAGESTPIHIDAIERRFVGDGTYLLIDVSAVAYHHYPLI
jgi:hypothetical protein